MTWWAYLNYCDKKVVFGSTKLPFLPISPKRMIQINFAFWQSIFSFWTGPAPWMAVKWATTQILSKRSLSEKRIYKNISFGSSKEHVKLDVYASTGEKKKKPVIIFVHGGSWRSGEVILIEFIWILYVLIYS